MEAHIHEWLNLLLRWIHMITGIAWIGASFYFNWLENNLDRDPPQEPGIAGNLWAIHGGGFYHLRKFSSGPAQLPPVLHWFKWEAYTTWLSGFSLLVVVYYLNARSWLIDPSVRELLPWQAIFVGLLSILGSWFVYDGLCRLLRQRPVLLAALIFGWFTLLAWILAETLSGRAAYIHVGAAIGTVMVANVFFVIIPAQREMVAALAESRIPDPHFGRNGLLRSRHNNYLTLPVLFTMISSHFPSTYGNAHNWLVLVALSLTGVAVRHYFNIRQHTERHSAGQSAGSSWILVAAFFAMAGIMWATAPQPSGKPAVAVPSDTQLLAIAASRCNSCHAETPTQAGFAIAPKGIILETMQQLKQHQQMVCQTSVTTQTMPLGNLTGMLPAEREQLAAWCGTR